MWILDVGFVFTSVCPSTGRGGLVVKVSASQSGGRGSIPCRAIPTTLKSAI